MTLPIKPTPPNLVELEQQNITPYLPSVGKPDSNEGTVFSQNRAKDMSRRNDKVKDISVSLEDIDSAVMYYFKEVIKPTVIQDGLMSPVPLIYSTPERWKSIQADGFQRDQNGKIIVPIIVISRTGIEKNRTLGNKLDANSPHNYQVFETKYNSKNQYDRFSVVTNRVPSKQYYLSVVPDYVTLTYQCTVITNYVEQCNKIIEVIEFASDSYWGDPKRWHFKTKIDSFAVTSIVEADTDRAAKSTFTITLNGYLIPDTINKKLASKEIFYSPAQVVMGVEVVSNANEQFVASSQVKVNQGMGSV